MRIVSSSYEPLPKDHVFEENDKVILSNDAWCCYNTGRITHANGKNNEGCHVNGKAVVWAYDPHLRAETWVLK